MPLFKRFKMKKNIKIERCITSIRKRDVVEGETMELRMARILENKDTVKDNAQLMYTDRKDGVRPEFNPKTDRFEVAIDAMDKVSKSYIARRSGKNEVLKVDKVESIQGPNNSETIH